MSLLGSSWNRLAANIAIASLVAFWLVVCLAEQSLVALAGVTGPVCFMRVTDRGWTLLMHVRCESIQVILGIHTCCVSMILMLAEMQPLVL